MRLNKPRRWLRQQNAHDVISWHVCATSHASIRLHTCINTCAKNLKKIHVLMYNTRKHIPLTRRQQRAHDAIGRPVCASSHSKYDYTQKSTHTQHTRSTYLWWSASKKPMTPSADLCASPVTFHRTAPRMIDIRKLMLSIAGPRIWEVFTQSHHKGHRILRE